MVDTEVTEKIRDELRAAFVVPYSAERMVRVFLALVASIWLAGFAAGAAQGEPFSFAGFHRDMDLAALLERYPQSSHEVSPGAGVRRRTSQDDLKAWIREFFRNRGSSGTYVLRLTPGESHQHLYYVQAEVRQGVTERLWLLLETPLDLVKPRQPARGNQARYPACNDVLSPLTAKYGKPEALAPRREEALESFDYVWTRSPETMKLQCGRYEGRKSVFAIGVTFEQSAPR
jgi:hypothetical protein